MAWRPLKAITPPPNLLQPLLRLVVVLLVHLGDGQTVQQRQTASEFVDQFFIGIGRLLRIISALVQIDPRPDQLGQRRVLINTFKLLEGLLGEVAAVDLEAHLGP